MKKSSAALAILLTPAASGASPLDVTAWLERPGVKLVAVELYATWCKPCMAAVPRWKTLHETYRARGLRLIVVSTNDPGSGCATPGWTPDRVVCDDDGKIADALGTKGRLPSAFLWSWQGDLLVEGGHYDAVSRAVESYLARAPRVAVRAGRVAPSAGVSAGDLTTRIRSALASAGKLTVVATAEEQRVLDEIKLRSTGARYEEAAQCEIGRELPPNAVIEARLDEKLSLLLLSAESGCLVASAVVPWHGDGAIVAAVEALTASLKSGADVPSAASDVSSKVIVAFSSDPAGAVVFIDGKLACTATPCRRAVAAGRHRVAMHVEGYAKRLETVAIGNDTSVEWKLVPTFGLVDVASAISGVDITVDGEKLKAPATGVRLEPGTHIVAVADRCFEPAESHVRIETGATVRVNLALKPRTASVEINAVDARSDAIAGRVFADGVLIGEAPGIFAVPVCAHELQLRAEGYDAWSKKLALELGTAATITARLGATNVEMVQVPAGAFLAGCNRSVDRQCEPDEATDLAASTASFLVDRTEVTVGAYLGCVRAAACTPRPRKSDCTVDDDQPVDCVDRYQAAAYCAWSGKRLPSNLEWEKAARGTDGRMYPWGNDRPGCERSIIRGCGAGPTAVGGRPLGASPYGALDMAGNVWEWTSDGVLRGGAFFYGAKEARASNLYTVAPGHRAPYVGFRCAK